MVGMVVAALFYLPIYYDLGVTSVYEYLEIRFGKLSRRMSTAIFIIQSLLYNGIVIYAPALALEQVAGVDVNLAILLVGGVCICYTTLGGIRAVIWTDVWQAAWMLSGFVGILVIAGQDFDGFSNVMEIAKNNNRLFTDNDDLFNPDPRIRHTFWTVLVGQTTGATITSWCCRQDKHRIADSS